MIIQRFIITKDSAYAMVTGDSSEIDIVFSLVQAQIMRKFMSKEEEWEQIDPEEAIRVELTLDGDNNMSTVYYAFDRNLIALFEELLKKEEMSIITALKLHKRMAEDGENY